ncbi:MAG TPA: cytochrome c [Gemmatimonadales bacterium]
MTAPTDPPRRPASADQPGQPPVGDGGVPEAGGVDLQPDVERIHRAILREPHDPVEGLERAPWFFVAAILLAIFWGGWYLGRFGGTFDTASHIAFAGRQTGIAAAAADQAADAISDPVAAGQAVYEKNCQVCHQASGEGTPGVFPPMVGSEWVTGEPETVVRIVLHGLQGPVEVAGATYNGAMPAWKDVLKEGEIAAVVTYIRQMGANDAPVVPASLVTAVKEADAARTSPWTAEELRQAPPVSAPAEGAPAEGASAPAAAGAADSATTTPAPAGGAQ